MKVYRINLEKIEKAEKCLDEILKNNRKEGSADTQAEKGIKNAARMLLEFMQNKGLVEDNNENDGFVRIEDARKAVMEAENGIRNSVEWMIDQCRETGAAKIVTSFDRKDGFDVEVVIRQKGLTACDEFSRDDLENIRMVLSDNLASLAQKDGYASRLLDIINVCSAKLDKDFYSSIDDFIKHH